MWNAGGHFYPKYVHFFSVFVHLCWFSYRSPSSTLHLHVWQWGDRWGGVPAVEGRGQRAVPGKRESTLPGGTVFANISLI